MPWTQLCHLLAEIGSNASRLIVAKVPGMRGDAVAGGVLDVQSNMGQLAPALRLLWVPMKGLPYSKLSSSREEC